MFIESKFRIPLDLQPTHQMRNSSFFEHVATSVTFQWLLSTKVGQELQMMGFDLKIFLAVMLAITGIVWFICPLIRPDNFYCHSNRVEFFDKQWKSSSCMAYRLFLAWTHRAHHTMHIEYSTSPLARASKKNVFHESLLSFWNF